jgi:hypothetical protein
VSVNDPKAQVDGYISFIGGQDAGNDPSLINPAQAAELWNCTVRGGKLRPRPGFVQLPFSFPTDEIAEWFETKLVQAVIGYRPLNRTGISVWSVGGRFFTVDIFNGGVVQEITTTLQTATTAAFTVPAINSSVTVMVTDTDRILVDYPIMINGKHYQVTAKTANSLTVTNIDDTPAAVIALGAGVTFLQPNAQNLGIVYTLQAEQFLIAQDGQSQAFIFDGSTSWRSQDMPVGTIMRYGKGRLWIAVGVNADAFVASDIVRSRDTGTASYGYTDSILHFTENTFLAGGGAFAAPGRIRAMAFMTTLDTATGQGPLLIFTEDMILSVNAPAERELWAVVRDPIVTQSLVSNGAMGFYSTLPTTNGDIFYRTTVGIQAFYYALREFGTWGNTPISSEVSNVIRDDDEELMLYTSGIVFDNRLLMTSEARPTNYGAYFKALVALDFHTISRMGTKASPVYDGVWTGIDVLWLFKVKFGRKERAFAAVRNADGRNEMWEITKTNKFDGDDGRIKWRLITRNISMTSAMEMKRLENLELWVAQAVGQVDLSAKYRPDEYPCWNDWRAESVCVDYRECGDVDCAILPTFRPGYKTRIAFGQPLEAAETNDNKPMRLGYEFQVSLEGEGYCEIRKLRLKAQSVEEEVSPVVS